MVDLPLADSPVNQTVKPCWPRKALRSACVRDGCHVMFLLNFFFLKKTSFGLWFSLGGGVVFVWARDERKRVRWGSGGWGIPTMLPFSGPGIVMMRAPKRADCVGFQDSELG